MIYPFRKKLSTKDIEAIEKSVVAAADDGAEEKVWGEAKPLLRTQKHQKEVALSLVQLVEDDNFTIDQGLEVLSNIYDVHSDDIEIVFSTGSALEGVSDTNQLNRAPPDHKLFDKIVTRLKSKLQSPAKQCEEAKILEGLATAARMMARQYDEIALDCYRRLVEIDPKNPAYYYSLGLFYKTRGFFEEGWQANQQGLRLLDEPREAYTWNLGICATGAGEGEIALDVWKGIGNKIEMGRFDLPEGRYPNCKVKLAERPLAERNASNDDSGLEETIWIERLSPCHGIIRSVLFQDLGIDYGDVILMDGAPITYHKYDDKEIPVFPHLATLVKSHYKFYDFAGTQEAADEINDLSRGLDSDAIVYSHTENYQVLCAECWRDPNVNHKHHYQEKKHIVTGKVAAPSDMSPAEFLSQIDKAVDNNKKCDIYIPELCEAAGLNDRANVEQSRFEMLKNN